MTVAADISVVIPARNRALVLPRAIESVLQQTLQPREIIIVDDGSTDNTVAVASEYARKHPFIRVIALDKNGGAPRARNHGIELATGKWIALLDSDDAWEKEKLQRQFEVVEDDVVAVFTNTRFVYPDRTTTISNFKEGDINLDELYIKNSLGGCSAAFIRKSSLASVGFFDVDLPSCQDWDLWIKLLQIGRIVRLIEALTIYFFDGNERISRNTKSVISGHQIVFNRIYEKQLDAKKLLEAKRFHSFHLAQTKVYSAGSTNGFARPALTILLRGSAYAKRKSAVHLLAVGTWTMLSKNILLKK
jgi:glycosyltransferase involved in cell wall biosynthesis